MKHLFRLGACVATKGAAELIEADKIKPAELLMRHVTGDWGCVCDEDRATNDEALAHGNRILSAYPIDPAKPCKGYGDNCIWIITEADRSATTILLPEEY